MQKIKLQAIFAALTLAGLVGSYVYAEVPAEQSWERVKHEDLFSDEVTISYILRASQVLGLSAAELRLSCPSNADGPAEVHVRLFDNSVYPHKYFGGNFMSVRFDSDEVIRQDLFYTSKKDGEEWFPIRGLYRFLASDRMRIAFGDGNWAVASWNLPQLPTDFVECATSYCAKAPDDCDLPPQFGLRRLPDGTFELGVIPRE